MMFEIPADLMARLEEIAQSQERPIEELVQDALRRYLAIQAFNALRQRTVPLAEAQGYFTDEDIFREVS